MLPVRPTTTKRATPGAEGRHGLSDISRRPLPLHQEVVIRAGPETRKPRCSAASEALCRTRTGDPFLTIEVRIRRMWVFYRDFLGRDCCDDWRNLRCSGAGVFPSRSPAAPAPRVRGAGLRDVPRGAVRRRDGVDVLGDRTGERLRRGVHTVTSRATDIDGNVQPAPEDPSIANKVTFWERNGQITRRVSIS
jgi:hypothetical protein